MLRYQSFIPEIFFMVVRVYDGGTIKAVGYDIEIKVRLVGIDAPETSKGKRKPGQPLVGRLKNISRLWF